MYEIENAEFEYARNKSVDEFFKARRQIERTPDKEFLVESGFRLAWELLKQNQIEELVADRDRWKNQAVALATSVMMDTTGHDA
ncbi:MAG: hypothetical protein ABL933_06390 [Methyloglobulus sp.]